MLFRVGNASHSGLNSVRLYLQVNDVFAKILVDTRGSCYEMPSEQILHCCLRSLEK